MAARVAESHRLRRTLGRLLFWAGPPGAEVAFILSLSGDEGSAPRTRSLLYRLLEWVAPDVARGLTPEAIEALNHWTRKGAHLGAYALLGLLIARGARGLTGRFHGGLAVAAWAGAVVCSAADEWRQSFYPSRGSSLSDVVLDACGALAGVAIYWLWIRRSTG
jgi:VanZ family protein